MPVKCNPLPSKQEVEELLDYCPASGLFRWKSRPDTCKGNRIFNTKFAGSLAGTVQKNGYVSIQCRGVFRAYCHRLAWLMGHGEDALDYEIDHRDGNPINNRLDNLRLCEKSQNGKNLAQSKSNTSGQTGVSWFDLRSKWRARITVDGRDRHLGLFDSFDDAVAARINAEKKYHGEFAQHCRPGL